MPHPGFEPGLPRPQRGVLTTRLMELSDTGNRTPGVRVTGGNVTNYTMSDQGATGIEPVAAGSAIPCSTTELSTLLAVLRRKHQLDTAN